MPSPERLPEAKVPTIKTIQQLVGEMDMRKYSAEMRLAKESAIRALSAVLPPDYPEEPMTLNELRAKLLQ